MITKHDMQEIFLSVKDNHARLDACKGPHDFVCERPDKPLGAKHRCTLCGGTVDGVKLHWYLQGLAHGKAGAS